MSEKRLKERVDILLSENGYCQSREQAKRMVIAGQVKIGNDFLVRKPSETFPVDTEFTISLPSPYVSRGAYKLQPAISKHIHDLKNRIAMDIGASTGGFTDLLLQAGAEKVYAIDVGYGQLHQKLRDDKRVICFEKTNARYLQPDFLNKNVDIITIDVSFISVIKILPAVTCFLNDKGWMFILVKPQFEAERKHISKGGVVRDETIQLQCVDKVVAFVEQDLTAANNKRFKKVDVIPSPVKGPKGNQEYMTVFRVSCKNPDNRIGNA